MEVAASRNAELALSDALLQSIGPNNAFLLTGRLEGPFETTLRGRAGSIGVWLWHGHAL